MNLGSVVLPVSLDISQVSGQAKQLAAQLGKLNIPGASNLEKQVTSAINYAGIFAKSAKTFADRQIALNKQTAAQLGGQAKSYLTWQHIATKSLKVVGKSLVGFFTTVKASHLPALGGITALGAGLISLNPVVSGLLGPMFGLTGGVGALASSFLNAQKAALTLGSKGLIGLIKTIAELVSGTSALKSSLKALALPSDLISSFGNLKVAFQSAVTQVANLQTKIKALGANLVSNAQGILGGSQGVFAGAAGAAGAGTNPLTAAFDANKGIGEYVAFEQNATAFQSLAEGAGATADQIKEVTAEAKTLGALTSKSATEVSGLSIAMLRLGISADEVDDALSGIVTTSEATGENLAVVGSIVASGMAQFNIAGSESAKIGDLLGKMANVSATSITEIGDALRYAGGVANAANQSLEDIVVVLGAVSSSQKGSNAGTNLSSALINLQKAASVAKSENQLLQQSVKLGKQELDEMADSAQGAGETVESFGKGIKIKGKILEVLGISKEDLLDSEGRLKSLLEIVPVIREAVKEMEKTAEGTAQVPVLINALFGEQGSRTILSLIAQTDEQLNVLKQSAETASGFTANVSEQMLSGISGSLKRLVSATQGVSLIVGETFAPIVKSFADEITKLLSAFLRLPPAFQKLALVGAAVMPFMILYWKYLGFQKQAIATLVLAKKTLILAQTAEGRQQIVLNIQTAITEAKTKALTVAKAAQVTVTKILRGEMSLLAAAQIGVNKALTVISANYKSYFSTLVYSINQIQLQIKGLGQLALSLTNVNVGQMANNALMTIGTGIKSAYVAVVGMANAAIARFIAAKTVETQVVAKGNLVQGLGTAIIQGLTIAKTALAIVTGRLSAATLGLAGTYTVLAARFALIYVAFLSVKAAWDAFTAGAENVKAIEKTRDEILELNKQLNIATPATGEAGNAFIRFFESLKNGTGLITSVQTALNLTTKETLAAQRSIIALEGQINAINDLYDNGIDIINKYGLTQADESDKTRLGAENIAKFTAEAQKQNEVIQAVVEKLKAKKPANDVEAQQINDQIKLLETQAKQLRLRADFLNYDTDITEKNTASQQALGQSIQELSSKYEDLAQTQNLDSARATLKIEEALASQAIDSTEAISQREQIEKEALENRIDLNNQALEELKKAAEWMPPDDRVKAEEEISKRTEEQIKLRIDLAKQEIEERQKLNEQLIANEQQKLEAIESQQQLASSQQVLGIKQQQATGRISNESADSQISNIEKQTIQELIELENQRMQSHANLLKQGAINEQEFAAVRTEVNQRNIELATELAEHEIQVAQNATAKYQEEIKQRLDAQKDAIENQLNLSQVATDQQVNQIKALQSQGELSAQESANKINKIKLSQIQKEIEIQRQALKNSEQNFRQGLIEQQVYVDEKNKISSTILSHEKALLDEQINQQEEAKNKLLEQIDEVADRRRQSFEENQRQQELALKQQELSGELSSDELEQAKQQAEIKAAQESTEIARQKLQEIHALESKGLKLSEEILDRKESAEKELLQAQINLVDQQLAAKKKAEEAAKKAAEEAAKQQEEAAKAAIEAEKEKNEQILKDFENRLAAEQSARELSIVAGITAARAQQLAGIKSKEQAEEAIAQIEQQARQAELAGLQQQIVKIQQLQNQGVLTAEEAARRKAELNKQLADGNLALIESQIQAEEQAAQRAIEAKLKVVEANLQAARTPLEMQSARSDIASNRLGLSSNLANAETGVLEARNTLEAQRIDFQMRQLELQAENAKSEAERERALLEAEKLKSQAFKNQFVAMQQSQQAAQVQLEISQRQKDIELQRQKISARIALLESQAELQKAKINGASAQEIQALAEMVKLRQETLSFTDEAIAGQEELKKLEAERLQIQQQAEKEKMAQERLLELEQKAVEATGQEREHILQQLKEAKKMQSQMETEALNSSFKPSNFEFPNLDLTPAGAKLKQNLEPMLFKSSASIPKPAQVKNQNFSGDIVGAEKIEINVNSGDRSSGVDIERTVLNALNTVIDKTKTKINEI